MLQLIIAKPSPFARKVRIVLHEKNIAFKEQLDVPWNADTIASAHNPLAKIPILLRADGSAIYDSSVIVEYLEYLQPQPRLIPDDPAARIAVKQVEALADGVCDAVVLVVLEKARITTLRSSDWITRQRAKIEAGIAEFARLIKQRPTDQSYLQDNDISLADISIACALAYLDLRIPDIDWRGSYPELLTFSAALESRTSFQASRPQLQTITALA